ncbi:hypothetical protein NE237_004705 [Protea cynaroides]|uniref:HMG box domain-containing protein n=1 Tax=Protea cynaroides TaxID=273540 RepID=A0A9Q0KJE8_9MAGN|nr:hypothetical protein NE237_004705 [Protea cynaroides]
MYNVHDACFPTCPSYYCSRILLRIFQNGNLLTLTGKVHLVQACIFQVITSDFSSKVSCEGHKGSEEGPKEALKAVDDRKVGKRKAAAKVEKGSKGRVIEEKAATEDPNKPKRPSSVFFVFMEEFRKSYKLEHPNVKSVSAVGKAGGEKWNSLSVAEKAPYEAKAAKRELEYEKHMSAYIKEQESTADDGNEESDRSRSEMHDDDDEEESAEVSSGLFILLCGSLFLDKSILHSCVWAYIVHLIYNVHDACFPTCPSYYCSRILLRIFQNGNLLTLTGKSAFGAGLYLSSHNL